METLALKNKPLFQATLGDLVEVMKEQLGFISEKGKDGRGNTNPSSEKRYVYGLFGISKLFGCSQATAKESNQVVSLTKLFLKTGRSL